MQQPICIALAARSPTKKADTAANVHFRALPNGHHAAKFLALDKISLTDAAWVDCPTAWRAPFYPASVGAWATYPAVDELFLYNGSGVMPGRTWVIAPDAWSLQKRWERLVGAPPDDKETLFHPHLRNGVAGDKHSKKVVAKPLAGYPANSSTVANESGTCLQPIRYGFRSFDQQWIIPDGRLINQPNPELWDAYSVSQVFLTALSRSSPSTGPALTISSAIPDLDHYRGSFGGRVLPLWANAGATIPNVRPALITFLASKFAITVTPEDLIAYIAAVAANPAYTAKFQDDLSTPGLRIPITADADLFAATVELGRAIVWLHTFGERMADAAHPEKNRPASPPRLPAARRPQVPLGGEISHDPTLMPDVMSYDGAKQRLNVGNGYIEHVTPAMWRYEVSGKQVLPQWFSYRKKNRDRPIIGDRRPPSPLGNIQPDFWLAEYTTELLNVLNVLGLLIDCEPAQAALLERICAGPCLSADDLRIAGVFDEPQTTKTTRSGKSKPPDHPDFFSQ